MGDVTALFHNTAIVNVIISVLEMSLSLGVRKGGKDFLQF